MAVSINDVSHAEPSSDFPTEEDCASRCARLSGPARLACAIGCVLAIGSIGFLIARVLSRRRLAAEA